MKRINWQRANVWASVRRNESAWLRTYDHLLKTAQQVQAIGAATLANQRNTMILHQRLQAVEKATGITPPDPQMVIKTENRMDC